MIIKWNLKVHIIMHHRYFIENEEGRPLYFTIGVNSGVLRTTQVLDREEAAWHNITVMAAEVGKFTGTTAQIKLSSLCISIHQHDIHLFVPSATHPKAIHLFIHLPLYVSERQPLCTYTVPLNTLSFPWEAYTSNFSWYLALVPVEGECTYLMFFCSRQECQF